VGGKCWVDVELTAVEEDGGAETRAISEAARSLLQPLNLRVEALRARVRDPECRGVHDAPEVLFFDNAFYFHFVERTRSIGITAPIVPGIMPITNFDQIERFTRLCGATIPIRLHLELERRKDDPEAILQLGVAHATSQGAELLRMGYTLNRSRSSRMILAAVKSAGF
jgi:methylenetetrahydrofolate reductase (NADPH)